MTDTPDEKPDVRVYFSTSTRPLPLENSDPLRPGERVTFTGPLRGSAIAHVETGALVLAPDDEQPSDEPQPDDPAPLAALPKPDEKPTAVKAKASTSKTTSTDKAA